MIEDKVDTLLSLKDFNIEKPKKLRNKKSRKVFICILVVLLLLITTMITPGLFNEASGFDILQSFFAGNDIEVPVPTGDPPSSWNWTIEDDTVYINNSWTYLSATPHTLIDAGWVEFELESKQLSGSIDVGFGFNSTTAQPKRIEIWRNYTHNLTGYHWVEQYMNMMLWVTAGENLGMEKYGDYDVDVGNENNTYLWNISYKFYEEREDEWYNASLIIAFTSKTPPGMAPDVNYTFFYYDEAGETYYYDSTFWDWKPFNFECTIVDYVFHDADIWYLFRDIPIQEDVRYKVRSWIDIPFGGLDGSSGKYWWVMKPNAKTIAQSIADGHFLYLDPWWDSDWDYYKVCNIADKIDEYQMKILIDYDGDVGGNVSCEGNCNANFSDIRFVLADGNNDTLLPYWIENATTNQATFWVNNTGNLSEIIMYYGNSAVGNVSDGYAVFLAFDDEDWVTDWTEDTAEPDITLAASTTVVKRYSKSGKWTDGAGAGYYHFDLDDISVDCAVDFYHYFTNVDWFYFMTNDDNSHAAAEQGIFLRTDASGNFEYYDGIALTEVGTYVINTWYEIGLRDINFDTDTYSIYLNDTFIVANVGFRNAKASFNNLQFGSSDVAEGYTDAIRVRLWRDVEPSWSSFGGEQSQPPANSNPVNSNPGPADTATDISINPLLNITVSDTDGHTMNQTFRTNASGNWLSIAWNNNTGDATLSNSTTVFTDYDAKYWWSSNLSDGNDGWDNDTYSFTTRADRYFVIGTSTTAGHGTGGGSVGHDPDHSLYSPDLYWHQYPAWTDYYMDTTYSMDTNLSVNCTNISWDRYNLGWGSSNMPIDSMIGDLNRTNNTFMDDREGWRVPDNPSDIDIIIVDGGGHDIGVQGDDAEQINSDIYELYNFTHSYGMKLIITTMTPDYRSERHSIINITNSWRKNFSMTHWDVWCADVFGSMVNWSGGDWSVNGTLFSVDEVHPNQAGYQVMGEIVAEQFFYAINNITIPYQSGESPANGSTDVSVTPSLYVICNDNGSHLMTATWRSNSSGSWGDFATNSSISTGTNITQPNNDFSTSLTTYYWSVNLTDGTDWMNETYHFTTEISPNNAPTIASEIPANQSTGIGLTPVCNVTASDADGDTLNVTFYENTSGSYVLMQKNTSVSANSNIQWDNYAEAKTGSTKYWWKVHVDDATDNVSKQFWFETGVNDTDHPVQDGNATSNLTITWNVTISDDSGSFNWTIECNGQTNSSNGDSNGSKNIILYNLSENITYTVFVNATDTSNNWNNQTYTFIIGGVSGDIDVIRGRGRYSMSMVLSFSIAFGMMFFVVGMMMFRYRRNDKK